MAAPKLSNLDLVNACDSFPYPPPYRSFNPQLRSRLYSLKVVGNNTPLGYVLPAVAEVFRNLPDWSLDDAEDDATTTPTLTIVSGTNVAERSAVVAKTCEALRQTGAFVLLKGWRDELYPVYGLGREHLFDIERAASPLFGVNTYGVHMTVYTRSQESGELKIWVPRRARTKQTYGGMLDNSVAGGIATEEEPFECLVREAAEEASLAEEVVRSGARACGTVTYIYVRDERAGGETGLLQPECQYVYDLEVEEDVVPKPGDNEVEEFGLWSAEEVRESLAKGEWKPNTALVMLDFFVRHGVLTPANEKDYIEIVSRLHRRLEFPTP
ncbi:hypothetical protein W97_00194 [Coniosporium apollinis CBS 100218]|uniref:Nudix hydrolase domain-containing protein n=1 Tax=Coniosporium apollinis (strain CBS 100218) TaxID=1168221 RepID=R7YGP7_CONA1|nr:uncharacterized protein W97_00194 [Coniosporium apollinis CBS 100218]EON60984.1 hypothetical protein W97_00194 [Coniosporium apollinis CBS 100218]